MRDEQNQIKDSVVEGKRNIKSKQKMLVFLNDDEEF